MWIHLGLMCIIFYSLRSLCTCCEPWFCHSIEKILENPRISSKFSDEPWKILLNVRMRVRKIHKRQIVTRIFLHIIHTYRYTYIPQMRLFSSSHGVTSFPVWIFGLKSPYIHIIHVQYSAVQKSLKL